MALCACLALGIAFAGCGEEDFANDPRPPSTVELTALISDQRVIVSPQPPGAGPVTITISNQSSDPATLTLTKGTASGLTDANAKKISSPEITPNGGTGKIQANLEQGSYTASAGDGLAAKDDVISVGPERKSAQNKLLLP